MPGFDHQSDTSLSSLEGLANFGPSGNSEALSLLHTKGFTELMVGTQMLIIPPGHGCYALEAFLGE